MVIVVVAIGVVAVAIAAYSKRTAAPEAGGRWCVPDVDGAVTRRTLVSQTQADARRWQPRRGLTRSSTRRPATITTSPAGRQDALRHGGVLYAHTKGWATVSPPVAWPCGLAATMVIGAAAGLLPALRAARMSPTQALWTL